MKRDGQKEYKVKKLKERLKERIEFREELTPGLQPKQLKNCEDSESYIVGWIDYLGEKTPVNTDNKRYMAGFEAAKQWEEE